MVEQVFHDLNEAGYPVNSLESCILAIFQQAKILPSDSHLSPRDIEPKIVARAKSGIVS